MSKEKPSVRFGFSQPILESQKGHEIEIHVFFRGLKPSDKAHYAKNGSVGVSFHNKRKGMTVTASIKNSPTEVVDWKYEVVKLPSKVIPNRCKWKIASGKVIINLVKEKEVDWRNMVLENGLDQHISGSESEPEGAVASYMVARVVDDLDIDSIVLDVNKMSTGKK